jgi:transcriptional regulator with XRE-family HTH domain
MEPKRGADEGNPGDNESALAERLATLITEDGHQAELSPAAKRKGQVDLVVSSAHWAEGIVLAVRGGEGTGHRLDLAASTLGGSALLPAAQDGLIELLAGCLRTVHGDLGWPGQGPPVGYARDSSLERLHALLHKPLARYRLARAIRDLRQDRGWTLRELAAMVQLSYGYLGRLERAVTGSPMIESAQPLLELLGDPRLSGDGEERPSDATWPDQGAPPLALLGERVHAEAAPTDTGAPPRGTDEKRTAAQKRLMRNMARLSSEALEVLGDVAESLARLDRG